MIWEDVLQEVVDLVELHLQKKEEPIDQTEIAEIANCSYDFFQRIFSYMNEISFTDYVRLRKLTLAGYDLQSTKMKVIQVSYRYGYDSPTSFTRAFQQFHGISPSQVRKQGAVLNVYPKLQFQKKLRYAWKMEHKPEFHLIGKTISFSAHEDLPHKIPEFWNSCQKDGTFAQLIQLDEGEPKGLFGVFRTSNAKTTEYAIMVQSQLPEHDGKISMVLPSCTWVVFDCIGAMPQAIQDCWNYLHHEWLVQYPFKHAPCPDLEWHSDGNSYSEEYFSQIWIPIELS